MNIGLLNTAGFQNFKYPDQGNFRTSRSTFISHSSGILHAWHQVTKYQWCRVASMWTEVEQGGKPADICLIRIIAYSGLNA